MVICSKDSQVRDAIKNNEPEIGIRLVDNTTNAIIGGMLLGGLGTIISQQRNTTPGMQAILQDAGYKYQETKFILFQGQVMFYEKRLSEPAEQNNIPPYDDSVKWHEIDIN